MRGDANEPPVGPELLPRSLVGRRDAELEGDVGRVLTEGL
jgi:hypothetical protein